MTKIKLCGLMSTQDVRVAMELGADYIGFVLASSKRQVSVEAVCQMLADAGTLGTLKTQPKVVLVMVDPSETEIEVAQRLTGASTIQLCGDEEPAFCQNIRQKFQVNVWKAWGIRDNAKDEQIAGYVGIVDAILLDTFKGNARGGTGQSFSWEAISRIEELVDETPLVIAGGLTAHTVGRLIEGYHPFAVDVSSGIETNGKKDHMKMREFVTTVRGVAGGSR